jgi:hypothetical protein
VIIRRPVQVQDYDQERDEDRDEDEVVMKTGGGSG